MRIQTPSDKIAQHFGIRLPDDLRVWLDNVHRIGKTRGYSSTLFNSPVRVDGLLNPLSHDIWAGLMPSDTLPILGNGCGDALLLRVGKDDTVIGIVKWDHEGGAGVCYGSSLTEAC